MIKDKYSIVIFFSTIGCFFYTELDSESRKINENISVLSKYVKFSSMKDNDLPISPNSYSIQMILQCDE